MKKLTIIAIFFFLFSDAFSVLAYPRPTEIQWPRSPIPPGRELTPTTQFHEFIAYIYEWGISLGGIVVFVMLVWAGIQYLTSAGDSSKMGLALQRIRSSILGLVLLLTSWLILNTINPQLVQLRPLPDLAWTRKELPPIETIDPRRQPTPTCDFIVVYTEENFQGKASSPIRFADDKERRIRIEGTAEIDNISKPWTSAKAFVKIDPLELERLNAGTITGIQRYNEMGAPDINGSYKEGSCRLDLLRKSGFLLWTIPCGRIMDTVQLPAANNIIELMENPGDLNCIDVRRWLSVRERDLTQPSPGQPDQLQDPALGPQIGL